MGSRFAQHGIVFLHAAALCFVISFCLSSDATIVLARSSQQVPTVKDVKAYEQAMEWFKKAQALIGTPKENSDEQAELFKKAIAIRPEFIEAHYNLGLIFAAQRRPEEAVREFETVRKLDAKFEGVYQLLATNYRDLGRNEDAAAALQEGLKQKPKDLPMLRALAFLQLHSGDDSSAIPTLQAILELEPKDADARMSLWDCVRQAQPPGGSHAKLSCRA